MSKKGFSPIIVILIVTLIVVGGMGGYTYFKNKQPESIEKELDEETSTTVRSTSTTTILPQITSEVSASEASAEYCLDWDFFFATRKYKDGQAYEEIKRIQEKLGVEPVGGHYGPQTQAAIEAFNRKYGTYYQGCCGEKDDYTVITQGTIAKFNELYCDKFYTIKIKTINTNSNTNCPSEKRAEIIPQAQLVGYVGPTNVNPTSTPVYYIEPTIVSYLGNKIEAPFNKEIIIKAPFSAGLTIGLNSDRIVSSPHHQLFRTYISQVYDGNNLIAKCLSGYENGTFDTSNCNTINPDDSRIFRIRNEVAESKPFDSSFDIFKIDKNYDLTIEVSGCSYQ